MRHNQFLRMNDTEFLNYVTHDNVKVSDILALWPEFNAREISEKINSKKSLIDRIIHEKVRRGLW